jgi:hypothetical protein
MMRRCRAASALHVVVIDGFEDRWTSDRVSPKPLVSTLRQRIRSAAGKDAIDIARLPELLGKTDRN